MFAQDLAEANQIEATCIPHLQHFFRTDKVWLNRLSPFITDIWVRTPVQVFKVEVKFDKLSEKTRNVALEHHAILKSTSDYLVYVLPMSPMPPLYCLMFLQDAKNMIGSFPIKTGGDQTHQLTLVPRDYFVKQSTII